MEMKKNYREEYKLKSIRYSSIKIILILLSLFFAILCLLHFYKNQDNQFRIFLYKDQARILLHFPEVKRTNIARQCISECGEISCQRAEVKAHRGG